MNIYILTIANDIWEKNDTELLKYISEQRKNRVFKYRHNIDKKLCLYSALLVRMKLVELTGISNSNLSFSTLSNQKPVLLSDINYNFNFSHTHNAILCGISYSKNIGVDIEKLRKIPSEIIDSSFHLDEKKHVLASKSPEIAFYEIWTQKEAYTKYLGIGLNDDLASLNTKHPKLQSHFLTWKYNEYICSTFSNNNTPVNIEYLSEDQILGFFL